MTDDQQSKDQGESYGPIELDRRTLTKLAGITGISVVTAAPASGQATTNTTTTQMASITPTFDRVLIQETVDNSNGNQASDPQSDDEPIEGIVRAVGNSVEEVSEGDKVLYFDEGANVEIQGEEHTIVEEREVLAIVED